MSRSRLTPLLQGETHIQSRPPKSEKASEEAFRICRHSPRTYALRDLATFFATCLIDGVARWAGAGPASA